MQTVNEIMTRDVFAVAPDTSLETTARMLAQKRISGAPVIDHGRVVGVISNRRSRGGSSSSRSTAAAVPA